jgi:hypothetical protein
MSKRRDRKAMDRWEESTRRWAVEAARDLAIAVYQGEPFPAPPYRIGVVLGQQESAWVECPARFNLDTALSSTGPTGPAPYRPWLITSERIVGRLGDDRLYGYRWDQVFGCRLDLAEAGESLALDVDGKSPLIWKGAGVAPMAVAAVYRLHGLQGLLDHPGLSVLRVSHSSQFEHKPTLTDVATR